MVNESITSCPALPNGWKRKQVVTLSGLNSAKTEVSYISPTGQVFTNKSQLERYLQGIWNLSRFDFESGKMLGGATTAPHHPGPPNAQVMPGGGLLRRPPLHNRNLPYTVQTSQSAHRAANLRAPSAHGMPHGNSHGGNRVVNGVGIAGNRTGNHSSAVRNSNLAAAAAAAGMAPIASRNISQQQLMRMAGHAVASHAAAGRPLNNATSQHTGVPRTLHSSVGSAGSHSVANQLSNSGHGTANHNAAAQQRAANQNAAAVQQRVANQNAAAQQRVANQNAPAAAQHRVAVPVPPDPSLVPPIRQTASIYKQPVTLVHTTSRESRSAPANELKQVAGAKAQKPKQVFWAKRLENMCAFSPQTGAEANAEAAALPSRILPVGPEVDLVVATATLAKSLQVPTPGHPITGQTGPKKSLETNPGVFVNPDQPLVQAVVIAEQDISAQERRVQDARRRLEEAIRHFG